MAPPSTWPGLTRRALLGGGLFLGVAWTGAQLLGHRPLPGPQSPFLGPSARRTLEAAFEALLPDAQGAREVAGGVDDFLAQGDPILGGQLRVALTVLEHAGPGPLRFQSFSQLSLAERKAVLARWQVSSVGPFRQIFAALRTAAVFGYYTRPATWDHLGYDGPWVGR